MKGWLLLACLLLPVSAVAQNTAVAPPAQVPPDDPDLTLLPGEPDFTVGALPTTLRMPKGKAAFRLTHRFSRPIAAGSTSDFFADFFGFDSSAKVGLEVRYGLLPGTQVTVHRTDDRTVQFLGQHELVHQSDTRWLSADVVAAVEGFDNFQTAYGKTIGGVFGHRFGEYASVYAEPMMVFDANAFPLLPTDERHTGMIGLAARVRLGARRTYVVAEAAPRVSGYRPGVNHVSVGIEKRAGGHLFQLNVSNSFGTTLAQIARGGPAQKDWFIGFNLTRKFY